MAKFFQNKKKDIKQVPGLNFGVCAHPFTASEYASNQQAQFDYMRDFGMTDYRFYIPLQADGSLINGNITKLNDIISKAVISGIKLFPILASGIEFAQSQSYNNDKGYNMGRGFCLAYPSNFEYLEIGNEIENTLSPFTGSGELITDFNSTKYGIAREFIKGMIAGIKSVNASIKIVVDAGDVHFGYIDQLLADGCEIAVIAWHWYSNMVWNDIAFELINRYPNKEIWFNEANSRSTDPAIQKTWLENFYNYLKAYAPQVRRFFIYELINQNSNPNSAEKNYGLVTNTGTYKAAGQFLKDLKAIRPPETHLSVVTPIMKSLPNLYEPVVIEDYGDMPDGYHRIVTRVPDAIHYTHTGPENCNGTIAYLRGKLSDVDGSRTGIKYKQFGTLTNIGTNPQWHSTDPNILYTVTSGRKLDSVNVITGERVTLYNFNNPVNPAADRWSKVEVGSDSGKMDAAGIYMPVDGIRNGVPVLGWYNILTGELKAVTRASLGMLANDHYASTMFADGTGMLVNNADNSIKQFCSYDLDFNLIQDLGTGSHADTGYDIAGNQIMAQSVGIAYKNMRTGAVVNSLSSLYNGQFNNDRGFSGHISMLNYDMKGWFLLSNSSQLGLKEMLFIKADGQTNANCIVIRIGFVPCDPSVYNPTDDPVIAYDYEPSACSNRNGTRVYVKTVMGTELLIGLVYEVVSTAELTARQNALILNG